MMPGSSNSSSDEEGNGDYCSNTDDETLPLMGGNNDEGEKEGEPTDGTSEDFFLVMALSSAPGFYPNEESAAPQGARL